MKLRNNFPDRVRLAFLYVTRCWKCGRCNNLELHHILGRVSASLFNAAPLCHDCHEKVTHSKKEHQFLVGETLQHAYNEGIKPTEEDWQFLLEHCEEIISSATEGWLEEVAGRMKS